MVAASAEYRVKSRHDVTPLECVADAKSAVRYMRAHASELGINPEKLAAGGGSAGGHLAACCGVLTTLDEPSENAKISSRPNAMVLFNPAVILAPEAGESNEIPERLKDRFKGRDPKLVSPYHHVSAEQPPAIIFHGRADTTVPYRTVELFAAAMKKAGNRCELVGYDGQTHGFFNFGRGEKFFETVAEMDRFLGSLGYLEGPATVEQFKKTLSH
jgi:acetyl esterase/lipase